MEKLSLSGFASFQFNDLAAQVSAKVAGIQLQLATWKKRAYDRHDLRLLSDEQIMAVGLDLEQVRKESEKPFWVE